MNLISKFKSVSDVGGTNRKTKLEIFSVFMNISAKADKSLQPSNLLSYRITTGSDMPLRCHLHISWTPQNPGQNSDVTPASAQNWEEQRNIEEGTKPHGVNHSKTLKCTPVLKCFLRRRSSIVFPPQSQQQAKRLEISSGNIPDIIVSFEEYF